MWTGAERRRWLLFGLWLACWLLLPGATFAATVGGEDPTQPALASGSPSGDADAQSLQAPQRARDVLKLIQDRQGAPPPGYVGGRLFHNRERRLPKGVYREYDVNPKLPGKPRAPERLVIEQHTGKAYYTGDHYRTFVPLN